MRNIALILMYNGTAYHGWQVQKTEVTVAQTLERGLSMVCGEPIKCTGCGRCINVCPMHAIHADYAIANELLNCKIAEYAKAVVDGRPSFHIALALDVSPCCDCHNFSDVPIVPNVGMFASFDPVALDTACADMINAQPVNPNSVIAREHDHPHDHFTAAHPDTDWRAAVEHGEAIGLGTTHYELVTV